VIRAFLFALDPSPEQEQVFRSHCGGQRVAYNWGLTLVKANLDQREAEQSYGLSGGGLTPSVPWTADGLRKAWNAAKDQVAPWWAEYSMEAYACGLANLATALTNWSESRAGKRKGPKVRFPRFESKRGRLSCRFTTGAFGLGTDRRHVQLPRIGQVRTHESNRKLARRVEQGMARIRSATLSHQRRRWHVSFSVELPDPQPVARAGGRVVGVDLGIKSLAVLSTGEVVPNPRHLDAELQTLRRLQRVCSRRRGPDKRTRVAPSQRWYKAKARVARLHTQISAQRRDELHQLTTRLVADHDTIVVEDLNVAGMTRNKQLARHIGQLGMGELRRQLTYKADQAGVRLVVADRWYPSSKTCSACGAVKTKLSLAERKYRCESCGLSLDRDVNAAHNLAALADRVLPGELRPKVKRPDGNPRKTGMAGSGYRHGKTPADRRGPTPHREVTATDHALTRAG
jgi:putative transposase